MTSPPLGRLTAAALILNAAWERAHWPLYECEFAATHWLRASAADAALTAGASALAARLAGGRSGAYRALLGGALTAVALGIEVHAASRGRWRYRPAMPTIGHVGLSPLAQLPVAGTIAVSLAARS